MFKSIYRVNSESSVYEIGDEASVTALMKLIEKKPEILKNPRLLRKIDDFNLKNIINNDGIMIAADGKPIKLNADDIERLRKINSRTKGGKKIAKGINEKINKSGFDSVTEHMRKREEYIDVINRDYKVAKRNNKLERKYGIPYTPNILQRITNHIMPGADALFPKTIGRVSKAIDKFRYKINSAEKREIGRIKRDRIDATNKLYKKNIENGRKDEYRSNRNIYGKVIDKELAKSRKRNVINSAIARAIKNNMPSKDTAMLIAGHEASRIERNLLEALQVGKTL